MMPLGNFDQTPAVLDSDAVTGLSLSAVVVIDDSWLEAVLDNLALANLSRADSLILLARLEELESAVEQLKADGLQRHQIVIGDHFDGPFNAQDMRSPETMTPENVLETIERAATHFATQGLSTALAALVFFISTNLDEVIAEEDVDED